MITVGSIVGYRYRLEQPIAQGGMGEVWKASHVSLLFPVAIKFAKPGAGDARFQREAHIGASVRHPHVVSVIDEGTTEDGTPFLVMEFLAGQSLAARLCHSPLPLTELVGVTVQVLRALECVHLQGVVHRDLKPENIFLESTPEGPSAKLLDFGVAHTRLSSKLAIPLSSLTVTGCTVGTPWYMAPEQARGLEVGPAADLFSLGVILYRALTGRFPFEGATLADIVLKSVTTTAIPPHELRPELSQSFSRIVLRALAVEPGARFADARQMREALSTLELPDITTVVSAASAPHAESLVETSLPNAPQATHSGPPFAASYVPPREDAQAPRRRLTLPEHPSYAPPLQARRRHWTAKGIGATMVLALMAGVGAVGWPEPTTGPTQGPLLGSDTHEPAPSSSADAEGAAAIAPSPDEKFVADRVAPAPVKARKTAVTKTGARAFRTPGF